MTPACPIRKDPDRTHRDGGRAVRPGEDLNWLGWGGIQGAALPLSSTGLSKRRDRHLHPGSDLARPGSSFPPVEAQVWSLRPSSERATTQ